MWHDSDGFERCVEAAVVDGRIVELVEEPQRSESPRGRSQRYTIRGWRAGPGTRGPELITPLNYRQAELLWREATGGISIGAGTRAAQERDRALEAARGAAPYPFPSSRAGRSLRRRRVILARRRRRVLMVGFLVAAGFAALLAALWSVGSEQYALAVAGTLVASLTMFWSYLIERGGS